MTDRNENLRFTLRNLLVITSLLAAALSVGHWTGSPGLSVTATLLVLGWVLHKFCHADLAGLIPCLLGIDLLMIHGIDWVYHAATPFFEIILDILGSFLVVCGLCTFGYLANSERPFQRWQAAHVWLFLILLIAWWVVFPTLGAAAVAQREARDIAHNSAAMTQAVAQVEAVRKLLGRVPTEAEFNELSKEPLPLMHWEGRDSKVDYRFVNNNEYELNCLISWTYYSYNSTQPGNGWVTSPF